MRSFKDIDPFVQLLYFAAAAGTVMLCRNPAISALACAASLAVRIIRKNDGAPRAVIFNIAVIAASALINIVFSHNGRTVLVFVNDTPITLEALAFGAFTGAAIAAVLNISSVFTDVMTSDRLLYIFGRLSPKTALLLSMALGAIPRLIRRTREVSDAQRVSGGTGDGSIPDRLRTGARVASIMLTWSLETGIVTADSMAARGWGTCRRTAFSTFRFRRSDACLTAAMAALTALCAIPAALGALDFEFYPSAAALPTSPAAITAYCAYTALILLPTILDTAETIKWKYLLSKI